MSIEFYVYSPLNLPLQGADLIRLLADGGWEAYLLESGTPLTVAKSGQLENPIVVGCRRDGDIAKLKVAVESGSEPELEALLQGGYAASCVVYSTCPWKLDQEYDEEELEEFVESVGTAGRKLLKSARSHYTVRTSAGRSDLSFALQDATWQCIGLLSKGLMEDPQSDEWWDCSKGKKRPLRIRKTTAADQLKAAQARLQEIALGLGMPPATKGGFCLRINFADVSAEQMEALARSARAELAPKFFLSLMQLTFRQFKLAKNRAWNLQNTSWLVRMAKELRC